VGVSDSHAALAKADRLDIATANSETPAQPAPVGERIPASEATTIGPSEAPKLVKRHRHDPKSSKVTTAAAPKPKSKPRTREVKRTTIPERSKTTDNSVFCRLSSFGGLRKALNTAGCEI
jgi:hypothetical protein